jgi:Amt family ammonium transporter
VIGPRLQRDREIDAPNNVAMVAVGAGLLWLGWNGFNGGDPYAANMSAGAAVLNTNLCTAVAFLVWIGWDYLTGRKPGLISGINGMITGLVAITPSAGYVNGFGAIAIAVIASTIVYFALNYLSRLRPFRKVDDTLGVIYTHGFAGLAGGLLVGVFADPQMALFYKTGPHGLVAGGAVAGLIHGNVTLLKWQFLAGLFVIAWTALVTFALLKLVGRFIPLRMSERNIEIGDIAEHGHEVYPADVPSLGFPGGAPELAPAPAPSRAAVPAPTAPSAV